jgi:hypothetical protein
MSPEVTQKLAVTETDKGICAVPDLPPRAQFFIEELLKLLLFFAVEAIFLLSAVPPVVQEVAHCNSYIVFSNV